MPLIWSFLRTYTDWCQSLDTAIYGAALTLLFFFPEPWTSESALWFTDMPKQFWSLPVVFAISICSALRWWIFLFPGSLALWMIQVKKCNWSTMLHFLTHSSKRLVAPAKKICMPIFSKISMINHWRRDWSYGASEKSCAKKLVADMLSRSAPSASSGETAATRPTPPPIIKLETERKRNLRSLHMCTL